MGNITPAKRPQIKRKALMAMISDAHPDFIIPDFFIVGIRGYYMDTMGEANKNDRNFYDDAIFLVGNEKEELIPFNGNTDPSAFREGIAVLKPGVWPVYAFDLHKGQYLALCQRGGVVTVIRDGKGEDTGMFGINIHRGGENSTSSLGCQTLPRNQFDAMPDGFIDMAKKMAIKYYGKNYRSKKDYVYVLLENMKPAAPAPE